MNIDVRSIVTVCERQHPNLIARVTLTLGKQEINIFGHTGYSRENRDVSFVYVNRTKKALQELKMNGLNVMTQEWVTAEMKDVPGSAGNVMRPLLEKNIEILNSFPYYKNNRMGIAIKTRYPRQARSILGPGHRKSESVPQPGS